MGGRDGVAGGIETARRKRRCNGVESGVEGLPCFSGDGNVVVMMAVDPALSFGTEAGVVVGLAL